MKNAVGGLIIICCVCVCACVEGATIRVALDGSGDYATIQRAIDAAVNGDEVVVADGTYKGEGNRDIEFKGKAITVRSENGPEHCIIDCASTAEDPHLGFLILSDGAKIDGLTITNGRPKVDSRVANLDAGGVYVHFLLEDISLTNCVITHNRGYGIEWFARNSVVSYCTVSDNSSYGVMFGGSGGKVRHVTATGNGVGIYCNNETAAIENCIATHNSIGIRVYFSDAVITGCYVAYNSYIGIDLDYISPTVRRCRIVKNKGRGICNLNASTTIVDCLIADNEGGGIEAWGSTYVYHCTIANNHAEDDGGGIFVDDCTVQDCIITGNTAQKSGDQLYIRDKGEWSSARFTISECLLQGGRSEVYQGSAAVVNWGGGVIDGDPNFAFAGDYHLRSSSICIDRGPSSGLGGGSYNMYDFDGNDRTMSRDGSSSGRSDFGAYEYCGNKPTIALSDDAPIFSMAEGRGEQERVFSIRNCGGSTLNWHVDEDCGWLEISPLSGTLGPDKTASVTVRVNGSMLDHGEHEYVIHFLDEQASNNGRVMRVRLRVTSTLNVPDEYVTIQKALDDAVDGDVVIVADGIYRGEGNRDLDMRGKAVYVKSANGPRRCIIDCEGKAGDTHGGFLFQRKEDKKSVVDGFVITNSLSSPRGAIMCDSSSPLIMNCIVCGNYNGGIWAWDSDLSIVNCMIIGNVGSWGGISTSKSNPTIINSTIAVNASFRGAGGIYLFGGKLSLINSIVWGNRGEFGEGFESQILTIDSGRISPMNEHVYMYNCIQGLGMDPNGIGNFGADPLFVDSVDGDFRLTVGSPCIGVGDPNGNYLADVKTDIEGDTRISFGRIDIGADEYVSYDPSADGKVDLADYAILSSYWGVEGCSEQGWCGFCDFTSDGSVDFADVCLLAKRWGESNAKSNYLIRGHWRMDEMCGTEALDESMHERTGTFVNMDDSAWVEGKVGGALEFDGVDDYVRVYGWKGILGGAARTCTAWIKVDGVTNANRAVMSWGNDNTGGSWLVMLDDGGLGYPGALRVAVAGGTVAGKKNLNDGRWHHIAVVLDSDGTPDVSEVLLYVDGAKEVLDFSSPAAIDTGSANGGMTSNDVRIGAWYRAGSEMFFDGLIDEVRIYDRALSAYEIAELAQ